MHGGRSVWFFCPEMSRERPQHDVSLLRHASCHIKNRLSGPNGSLDGEDVVLLLALLVCSKSQIMCPGSFVLIFIVLTDNWEHNNIATTNRNIQSDDHTSCEQAAKPNYLNYFSYLKCGHLKTLSAQKTVRVEPES